MIKKIAAMIEHEAEKQTHPDPIARIYAVEMLISEQLMKRFVEIRDEQKEGN